MKKSDGVVCSADAPLCLEVKHGVGIVCWMPVCPSHVSDEDKEEQISLSMMIAGFFYLSHAQLQYTVK